LSPETKSFKATGLKSSSLHPQPRLETYKDKD